MRWRRRQYNGPSEEARATAMCHRPFNGIGENHDSGAAQRLSSHTARENRTIRRPPESALPHGPRNAPQHRTADCS